MALNSGKILMRRGQEVNFDPSKMTPGEWAVSLDSKYVRMCFSPGVCVRMATYDAFEADMEQMRNILQECKSIEEFVERVYNEIQNIVIDVERIELASANALKSEQNALNSANTASESAEIATNKANEAIQNANTASVKAEQAINSAEITVRKAGEAEVSADNSQNMSIQSQSYAVGGTGTREGEDTDNSKYYNEQSKSNAERAEDAAERAVAISGVDIATVELAGLVKPDGDSIKILPDGTIYSNTPEIERKLEETTEKVNIIIQKAELNIKDIASGDRIHLTDSADGKIVDFALFGKAIQKSTTGKNILSFDAPYSSIMGRGLDFITHEDNSVTVRGTATSQVDWYVVGSWEAQTNALPISEGQIIVKGYTPTPGLNLYVNGYQTVLGNISSSGEDLKLTINSNNTVRGVFYRFAQGYTYDLTIYPMIRVCDEFGDPIGDDTYEPYTGGNPSPNPDYPQDIEVSGSNGNVNIVSCGKNILKNISETKTVNGVTFTVNDDKSVSVTGTATGEAYIQFPNNIIDIFDKNTEYIVNRYVRLIEYSNGTLVKDNIAKDGEYSFILSQNTTEVYLRLQGTYGGTCINDTIYPMIRRKTVKDNTYEPYKSTSSTLSTPNGIAGIKVNSDGNYTDENGQQWICDEIVKYADGTGKRIKRINKVIADGVNLAFSKRRETNDNVAYGIDTNAIPAMKREYSNDSVPLMSSHFITMNIGNIVNDDVMGITKFDEDTEIICGFGLNSELLNLELANSWLRSNNVTIYYQLETPVETPLTSEEIAEIEKLHTFYPVTNISNDADCGMKVKYIADSKNYIDNKLALQAKAREEEMMNMLLLLPEEIQAKMIENDTNNLLTESEE